MDLERAIDDLAGLGFFKFVHDVHLEDARNRTLAALSQSRSLDFGFDWDADHRIERPWRGERFFHADAEELAESGVADFLWRLIPLLTRESVSVEFLADLQGWNAESGRTSYEILVNADRHVIYEFDSDDALDLWKLSHCGTIKIINALLERCGSQERAFGAASGNDAGIYVLTPALYEYIRQMPLDPVELPISAAELRNGAG